MSSTSDFQRQPALMELRVVERGGKRVLQQWRNVPGRKAYEFGWIDITELPMTGSVSPLKREK